MGYGTLNIWKRAEKVLEFFSKPGKLDRVTKHNNNNYYYYWMASKTNVTPVVVYIMSDLFFPRRWNV